MSIAIEKIRNVVLCGHGSAGKTSLADQFLMLTGSVGGSHSVEDGTSICDFDPEEKKHKYSIEAAAIHFEHHGPSVQHDRYAWLPGFHWASDWPDASL